MTVMRDVVGYPTSRDYGKLWDLAQNQSIVCVVDHRRSTEWACRDVCHTIAGLTGVEISARGTTYADGDSRAGFAIACEAINLEWIQPTASQKADPIARWIEPDSSKPPALGLYLTEEEYPDSIDRSVMSITSDDDEIFVSEIDVEGRCSWVEFAEMDRIDRYLSVPIEWPSP